jgi:hypothetical protein
MEKQLLKEAVIQYVEQHIGNFHEKRIFSLDKLKLKDVLRRKNPYLFKAKSILTAEQLVRNIVDAHISSSEEGIFGDWLEGLAIFINHQVYGGYKSSCNGIDLEFDKEGTRYLVSIKSGPNWGNKSQVEKMVTDFNDAKRTLSTSGARITMVFVNGCCYGKDKNPHKFPKKGSDYFKFCGQQFWEFISGESNLYIDLIEPIGTKAKEKNEEYLIAYSKMINLFTSEFSQDFCTDGIIDWKKLLKFNSAK